MTLRTPHIAEMVNSLTISRCHIIKWYNECILIVLDITITQGVDYRISQPFIQIYLTLLTFHMKERTIPSQNVNSGPKVRPKEKIQTVADTCDSRLRLLYGWSYRH